MSTTEEEKVTYSGDTRVVKHLLFPYFVIGEHPMIPGQEIYEEKTARRGEEVPVSDLRKMDLEKGERLGSFFNDEELKAMERIGDAGGDIDLVNSGFNASEAGEHEIAEHITSNKLNVDDTVALAGGDVETAQRVLEAESIASGGDSRKGVVAGLEVVISRANQ
jgi:hypothetical protein